MDETSKTGYIFLCSNATEDECFQRQLFGGTLKYKSSTQDLEPGDLLFLYNYTSQKLHGIYSATSLPQENIVSEAWEGRYPWQVKIKIVEDCEPIPKTSIESIIPFHNGFPVAKLTEEKLNAVYEIFKLNKLLPAEEKNFRDKFPARIRTDDGHLVRSRAEAAIDNWLFHQHIVHAYERKIPVVEEQYCDFYIFIKDTTDKIYIEYWGLQDKEYKERQAKKIDLYQKYNLKLIQLAGPDVDTLDDILPKKILEFIPDHRFS